MAARTDTVSSDEALVHEAIAGSNEAFAALSQRYRGRLHAKALSRLGFGPDAEDAVQETLLKALIHLQELRDPKAVAGWLFSIIDNECNAILRMRRRIRPEAEFPEPARAMFEEADLLELVWRRVWVMQAVERLSLPLRETVLLRYFSSHSRHEVIARVLGVPVGTVKRRLHEARRLLLAAADGGQSARPDDPRQRERIEAMLQGWNELYRGDVDRFMARYRKDLTVTVQGERQDEGFGFWREDMIGDLESGTRVIPKTATASGDLVVMEHLIENPPEIPDRCPPASVGVLTYEDQLVSRLKVYLAPHIGV